MTADPWGANALLATFAMWVVMMAVMMLPSVTPFLRVVSASRSTSQPPPRPGLSVPVALTGYFLTWTAFSALAAFAQAALAGAGLLGADLRVSDPRLAAALLSLAGVHQLSPWKVRLVARCVHPIGLLLRHPGSSARVGLTMGAHYGLTCLGCCAPLMLVLFAVGVMNVAWILALTAFVFAEKYSIGGALLSRATGVALVAYAAYKASGGGA